MMKKRKEIEGSGYYIIEERLSTLCKLFREGEESHFAQFYAQTAVMGECIIKGLESPNLPFKERKKLHDLMWGYLHNEMGYKVGFIQRVKNKPTPKVVTIRKSLKKYGREISK